MRLTLLLGISILLSNCNHYDCPATAEINKEKFKHSLTVIKKGEVGRRSVLVNDYKEAINFLSLVTAIDSKADYSSTFGYRKKLITKMT